MASEPEEPRAKKLKACDNAGAANSAVRYSARFFFLFFSTYTLISGVSNASAASKSSAATKLSQEEGGRADHQTSLMPSIFNQERMAAQLAMMRAVPGEPHRYVIQGPPIDDKNSKNITENSEEAA